MPAMPELPSNWEAIRYLVLQLHQEMDNYTDARTHYVRSRRNKQGTADTFAVYTTTTVAMRQTYANLKKAMSTLIHGRQL